MATDLVKAVSHSLQRTADYEGRTQEAEQSTSKQWQNESGDNTRASSLALSRVASKDNNAAAPEDVEKDSGKKVRDQSGAGSTDLSKAMLPVAIMVMAVFWINLSHIYGVFYNQGNYVKRATVAIVDFDDGLFGNALLQAASSKNRTYGFPTYKLIPANSTSPEQIRSQVFDGTYWAALYAFPGASDRLAAAVNGSSVEPYKPENTIAYITMGSRYFALYQTGFFSTSVTVASTAAAMIGPQALGQAMSSQTAGTPLLSDNAIAALGYPSRPIEIPAAYHDYDLDPRALLNTLGSVVPLLMQFFFIMGLNALSNGMHFFAAKSRSRHILHRQFYATLWPLISTLCITGWTFAFKGDYPLNAKQFFALWAITWLYAMISFELLDIVTAFVPMPFVPFIFVTYVLTSVTASISSPEILHHWYRVSYIIPSLHWFSVSITILTRGGVNHLRYNLPVLFVMLLLLKVGSIFATRHRVKIGRKAFTAGTIIH